jgi:magnesium chelatase subunit D
VAVNGCNVPFSAIVGQDEMKLALLAAAIARDGSAGRERAGGDAFASARVMRAAGFKSLLVNTSPQPQAAGAKIAVEMGEKYLPLPHADAAKLSQAVLAAMN